MPAPALREFRALTFAVPSVAATRYVSQPAGALLAYAAMRAGLSPSAVTLASLVTSLAGCMAYVAPGPEWTPLLAAAFLYQLGYALDCADGQLARATGRTSALGAWLDVGCDHVRNVAIGFAAAAVVLRAVPVPLALFAAGSFLAGMTFSLHTSYVLRSTPPAGGTAGFRSTARRIALAVLDTPIVLLGLCLLQRVPWLLVTYLLAMAFIYSTIATLAARRRL